MWLTAEDTGHSDWGAKIPFADTQVMKPLARTLVKRGLSPTWPFHLAHQCSLDSILARILASQASSRHTPSHVALAWPNF